jgi:hypothetical protein
MPAHVPAAVGHYPSGAASLCHESDEHTSSQFRFRRWLCMRSPLLLLLLLASELGQRSHGASLPRVWNGQWV